MSQDPYFTESQSHEHDAATVYEHQILAAGFNGHGQLSNKGLEDIFRFEIIYATRSDEPRMLFTGWSTTTIFNSPSIISFGHQEFTQSLQDDGCQLKSGFGDHNGVIGFLDSKVRLHLIRQRADGAYHIEESQVDDARLLTHVACAGNDRIAVILEQNSGDSCEILEFKAVDAFRRWLMDSTVTALIDKHHELSGRPKQLLANTGTFTLLMQNGDVYTWGDSRYRSLARAINGADATPADSPGFVEALGGLKITKIASGGWMSAAISEDGAAYFWGTTTPGKDDVINFLREAGAGNTALIELPGSSSDDDDDGSEPLDVSDIAIGENHAIAVTEDHRIFAVGENRNGQLGLGDGVSFSSDWQEVHWPKGVANPETISVFCGPKTSFVFLTHLPGE